MTTLSTTVNTLLSSARHHLVHVKGHLILYRETRDPAAPSALLWTFLRTALTTETS
jgi:hypothetical protein